MIIEPPPLRLAITNDTIGSLYVFNFAEWIVMTLASIRDFPSCVGTGPNGPRIHESCFRSYQMLMKVRELLLNPSPVPQSLILELIDDVMDAPQVSRDINEASK